MVRSTKIMLIFPSLLMPLRRSMSQSGTNCHAMSLQIVSKKMIFVSHELELTIITGTTECSISM